jgi:heme-degrading monooxygenase HmoA
MSVDLPDHWLLFPPFKRVAKMHMPDSPACRESILIADWSCLSPHCQRQVEEVGEKTLAEGKESPLAASHGIDYGREWSSRLEAQVVGVLSRFVVANDMAAAVKQAFLLRPHLVDNAQGYVRMDVLTPEEAPNEIWLLTYWDDLASYRTWHKSHAYHESHAGIPKGLKLVPGSATLRIFNLITSYLVGGYAFKIAPNLWRNVGADYWTRNASEAVSLVGGLEDVFNSEV